jgi:myo-inositol-1(or 4)-monophosphatase
MDVGIEKLIQKLALDAGKDVAKKFGKGGMKYTKTDFVDVVPEAGHAANRPIISRIRKKYPEHESISEEMPLPTRTPKYVWTIKPLDGTRNFVTRMPLICTMISFAVDNRIQLAAIYDPAHNDPYFALKGRGAYLDGKRTHCSGTREWERTRSNRLRTNYRT